MPSGFVRANGKQLAPVLGRRDARDVIAERDRDRRTCRLGIVVRLAVAHDVFDALAGEPPRPGSVRPSLSSGSRPARSRIAARRHFDQRLQTLGNRCVVFASLTAVPISDKRLSVVRGAEGFVRLRGRFYRRLRPDPRGRVRGERHQSLLGRTRSPASRYPTEVPGQHSLLRQLLSDPRRRRCTPPAWTPTSAAVAAALPIGAGASLLGRSRNLPPKGRDQRVHHRDVTPFRAAVRGARPSAAGSLYARDNASGSVTSMPCFSSSLLISAPTEGSMPPIRAPPIKPGTLPMPAPTTVPVRSGTEEGKPFEDLIREPARALCGGANHRQRLAERRPAVRKLSSAFRFRSGRCLPATPGTRAPLC
jgi:hypothetical protein